MKGSVFVVLGMLIAGLAGRSAAAYSEFIRHGYPNCTSCHLSPAGGGALTNYGRQLAVEALSAWGVENEGEVGHALLSRWVARPEWLLVGGDVRALGVRRDATIGTSSRLFLMQADVEVGATLGQWTTDVSGGYYGDVIQSRRHYAMFRPSDEAAIRAGKFQPAFGLLLPDHTSATRRALGWDEGSETYNLEASWLGERFSGFGTLILGRPDVDSLNREKGVSLRPAVNISDQHQAGLSYLYGTRRGRTRHLLGLFAILGFSKHVFLLSEIDFQFASPVGATQGSRGMVEFQKLGWELVQGWNAYVLQTAVRLDFLNSATGMSAYGIGTQFFPRPHFEFNLEYQKQESDVFRDGSLDSVTLLTHYYI